MPQYKTTNLLRKKKLRLYWCIALTVIFVATVFFGVSYWSADPRVSINTVIITGNQYTSSDTIHQIVERVVRRPFALTIHRDNILLLPKRSIETEIEKELAIETAYVRIQGLRAITIDIVEHEPVAQWCDTTVSPSTCYLLNRDGLLFVRAPDVTMGDMVSVIADIVGEPLGQQYVAPEIFRSFILIVDLLQRINVAVTTITTTDYETFTLQTRGGPYVLIDTNDEPLIVANNLKTMLEQESIHDIQFQNLEYIDLRFEGKAYYKIK